ncbi:MAG: phytoene/squalene synthase family protein [Verrucomicrobiota bacterium]
MTSLALSFESCRQITQHHAKTFYFASHTLPPSTRQGAYAIYAFCRLADDAVDFASSDEERRQAVLRFRSKLDCVYLSQPFDVQQDPWIEGFSKTVQDHRIPRIHFEELLEGMTWDQGRVRLQTWEELDRYCYLVAGVVGVIMTHIFTEPRPELLEAAKKLGTAMQLTNILRDVKEDYERDRIYLPQEELLRYQITEENFKQGILTPEWIPFMQFQIERTRSYYTQSEEGIRGLPSGGVQRTVWLMRVIYSEILHVIEKENYNIWKGRARVSFFKKLSLALGVIFRKK